VLGVTARDLAAPTLTRLTEAIEARAGEIAAATGTTGMHRAVGR